MKPDVVARCERAQKLIDAGSTSAIEACKKFGLGSASFYKWRRLHGDTVLSPPQGTHGKTVPFLVSDAATAAPKTRTYKRQDGSLATRLAVKTLRSNLPPATRIEFALQLLEEV
jgi:transposase-like protein